ncbi:amino acid ABC transporter substrate-binding protein [uncultured Amphritea sp.]|uniref:amino acid ABC transporter substrate-binding protein n=1 Tax=uncultured Amphritea sp. TaxID=981605 RepID=UPI00262F429E|nr:amino acid ABC transporter substrate-binding protein [uncultured Amphritea sp.]
MFCFTQSLRFVNVRLINLGLIYLRIAAPLLALMLSSPMWANDLSTLNIALIEYANDPSYREEVTDARYQAQPWGRLDTAVELAIKESRFAAQKSGIKFELVKHEVDELAQLPELILSLQAEGTQFLLLDLPSEGVKLAAQAAKYSNTVLFNLSGLDNNLRDENCQANLLHIAPSRRMLTDTMAQYLIFKKWKEVLVLHNETVADQRYLESLQGSAKKFGLDLVALKPYTLGNDPRQRYQNNISLLTAKDDYDVVYVVDSTGEFAVDVPYAIVKPRPVVGASGLVADWWHWAWERNGAPQVNKRFKKKAKRQMTGYDWSAWLAVKVIAQAMLDLPESHNGSVTAESLLDLIRSEGFKLDGAKGYPLNFRPWNNQLRQPIFLTSLNRVIGRAPIDGFLHPVNNLDVLGSDQDEGRCKLNRGVSP